MQCFKKLRACYMTCVYMGIISNIYCRNSNGKHQMCLIRHFTLTANAIANNQNLLRLTLFPESIRYHDRPKKHCPLC